MGESPVFLGEYIVSICFNFQIKVDKQRFLFDFFPCDGVQ